MTSDFLKRNNKEKGAIAIILTILIIGVTLFIAIGLSNIFISEMKNSRIVAYSGRAFYAADAGAEYALFKMINANSPVQSGNYSATLSSNATFDVSWDSSGINSLGSFSGTKRKVEIKWE